MRDLIDNVKFSRPLNRNAGASGSTVKGTIVDMLGYDGVVFLFLFQTVVNNAVVTCKVADGDVNDTAQMTASAATSGAITSDGTTIALANKGILLDINNPKARYLEPQVVIATQNAPIDAIVAIRYRGTQRPEVQPSDIYFADVFVNPQT